MPVRLSRNARAAWRNGVALLGLLVASPAHSSSTTATGTNVVLHSPNGRATIAVSISGTQGPRWSVFWRGRAVLAPARIGLRFAGESAPVLHVESIYRSFHDGMVTGMIGKASRARDRYREAVVLLTGGPRPLELILRAYDDGVAYRWRFHTSGDFAIADEDAGVGVPQDARIWATAADGFGSSYENYYQTGSAAEATVAGQLVTLPLLIRRGKAWAGVTEASLHEWAGLYLVRHDGQPGFDSRLSPRLDRREVAVTGGIGDHRSPWRLVILGDAPGRLIESNLVTLLNPPPDGRDWSWVKPGKTSFPWWHDYHWPGERFAPGLNTTTMKAYIDFDAARSIPYHTLDGFRDEAWYGGPIIPDGRGRT